MSLVILIIVTEKETGIEDTSCVATVRDTLGAFIDVISMKFRFLDV